jgi:cytochrome c oxidase subunit 2
MGFVGIPMLPVLFDIGRDPGADAYPIEVTGQRFQWSFKYPNIKDARTGEPVVSPPVTPGRAAELHIPAGKEISLSITSIDVNHSFGVPRLAGTQDAIPGKDHKIWIKADHPGSFAGQFRELCGVDHWGMLIRVIAQNQEDFDAWAKEAAAGVKQAPDSGTPSAVAATGSGE